jgi:hypothetical protein
MAGTARGQGSTGDYLSHFTGVRIRLNGSGVMRPTLLSQDEGQSYTLPTITMASTNRFSSFVLANATEERALLQLQTTAINEDATIHRITIFTRVVAVEIPA